MKVANPFDFIYVKCSSLPWKWIEDAIKQLRPNATTVFFLYLFQKYFEWFVFFLLKK